MNFRVTLSQGAINSTRGNLVKGGVGPGPKWAGSFSLGRPSQACFGPSAPVSSPVASRAIPYLCALACEPLTSFPSRLRLESCYPSFAVFILTLRSSVHLESCSSHVLTLVGLHDLLLKCLTNLSRKSPL
jgi:hypothetical protein